MKKLLFALALLFPSAAYADSPTYKVKAVAAVETSVGKSCGATKRMLRDRHRITVRDGEFYINGMRWANVEGSDLPGEAYVAFHQAQKVWLSMRLVANDRKVIGIYALHDEGQGCSDMVRVEGERL